MAQKIKNWIIYKKLHRWPGLILSFIMLYYGITGIFMNHRELFSGLDIGRKSMPDVYQYQNWNNAAVKGNLIINKDSVLVYGNIGIWLTDTAFSEYTTFNQGFPKGSDNRKIFDLHRADDGHLYAASLFGLYTYNREDNTWVNFELEKNNKRFTGIESIGDTLYALSRSHLYKAKSAGSQTIFEKIELPAPVGYVNEVSLFETIWQLHSGEIFGLPGKLFVDFLGLITIFLSVTGIIYFFFPDWIKRRKKLNKPAIGIIKISKWSLKWHNKTGAWFFGFLLFLYFTGIFLRPPLLILVGYTNVPPLKFSHLDQPNPWHDKLRDILYDKERKIFLFSTLDGMYYSSSAFEQPKYFRIQPPVSVMGINTFEKYGEEAYLIGSFSGLFLWHPGYPEVFNYAKGTIHQETGAGRPIGDFKITGTIRDTQGNLYMADYDQGILPVQHHGVFPNIPQNVLEESQMSLWNFSLELHTGRIFQALIGDFYILIVPLAGLAGMIVVFSGYMLWRRKYKVAAGKPDKRAKVEQQLI
jgi:hypothetical protein